MKTHAYDASVSRGLVALYGVGGENDVTPRITL